MSGFCSWSFKQFAYIKKYLWELGLKLNEKYRATELFSPLFSLSERATELFSPFPWLYKAALF